MHLQNPKFSLPQSIRIAHACDVIWADPIMIPLSRQSRMWKFTHDMSGDLPREPPPPQLPLPARDIVKFRARDVRVRIKIFIDLIKYYREIQAQSMLFGVRSNRIGASDIGLPRLKDRRKIEENRVIFADIPHWWVIGRDP
jgi:hypothetical protein